MGTSKNSKNNITAMFAKKAQRSQSIDIYFFALFAENLRSSLMVIRWYEVITYKQYKKNL